MGRYTDSTVCALHAITAPPCIHSHVPGPGGRIGRHIPTVRQLPYFRRQLHAELPTGNADETVEVLDASVSDLREAPAGMSEGDFVIVDGTLTPTDRIAAAEPLLAQAQEARRTVQVIAAPDGSPCTSRQPLPGACTIRPRLAPAASPNAFPTCQILALTDRAHQGAGTTARTSATDTMNVPPTTSGTTATTPAPEPPANAPCALLEARPPVGRAPALHIQFLASATEWSRSFRFREQGAESTTLPTQRDEFS